MSNYDYKRTMHYTKLTNIIQHLFLFLRMARISKTLKVGKWILVTYHKVTQASFQSLPPPNPTPLRKGNASGLPVNGIYVYGPFGEDGFQPRILATASKVFIKCVAGTFQGSP